MVESVSNRWRPGSSVPLSAFLWLILVAAAASAFAHEAPARPQGQGLKSEIFDPDRVEWRRLDYTASKLFVTMRSTIELQVGGPWDAEPWLDPPPDAATPPIAVSIADHRLSLETSVLGRRSLEAVRFRGTDGQAVQRYKRRFGSRAYAKTQRFMGQGVFLTRVAAADESERTEAQWSRRSQERLSLPTGAECGQIVDPIQIFYLIAASSVQRVGDGFSVCAFSKDAFARLNVTAVESVSRRVEHEEKGLGSSDAAPSGDERAMLWLDLSVRPPVGEDAALQERFELIGLEGNLRILFDPQRRLPVEIRGKHEKMGTVSVRLQAANGAAKP